MSFFIDLVKYLIFILFPLILFKTFDGIILREKYTAKIVVFISLIIGMFCINNDSFLIFLNIPLSIFLLKKEKLPYLFITIIILFYCYYNYLYILLLEYMILLVLFFMNILSINIFLAITIYFYSLNVFKFNNLFNILLSILFYYLSILYVSKIYVVDLSKKFDKMYSSYLFKFINEVKNPLAVIVGYLEIINKKDKDDVSKYLMIIDKQVNESLNIIEDYLMYGRFNVNFDYVDINMLLKEVSDDYKKLENIYNMRLNFYYDEEELIVLGDYSKLKQVIVNIIKNSIEAHIDKKLEIDIDYKIINKNIVIDINDNGVGIKDTSLIGKEFYSTKENELGLGVNFSRNIIKLHKGNIKYISRDAKGVDVRISLPLVNVN